jgi:hypothetical protein
MWVHAGQAEESAGMVGGESGEVIVDFPWIRRSGKRLDDRLINLVLLYIFQEHIDCVVQPEHAAGT